MQLVDTMYKQVNPSPSTAGELLPLLLAMLAAACSKTIKYGVVHMSCKQLLFLSILPA